MNSSVSLTSHNKESSEQQLAFPELTKEDFEKWTILQLQNFLQDREINKTGKKEQLVINALNAYNLGIPVSYQDIGEEDEERRLDHSKKLSLEDGLVSLPDPSKLVEGWVAAPTNLPNTTYDEVMEYLNENDAGKAYKGGKSFRIGSFGRC